MGPAEVALMRDRVQREEEPWATAAAALSAVTPLSYSPHALKDFNVDWNGKGQGHKELVEEDGVQVYQQTMMWLITGDTRYAQNACNIICAWATTCERVVGNNAPLECGWGYDSFSRSAELLKFTYPAWPSQVEQQYVAFINRLVMCQLRKPNLWTGLPLANWQTTIAECKAQFAILTGNRGLWEESLADWRRLMDAYIKPCGECTETNRDLFHSQFGLGGLIQLAEIAWHQGIDLYGYDFSKLSKAMEFHAYITNGGKPEVCNYALKGIGFLPCGWEVGYNHYHGRMGLPMPETDKMLNNNRPEKYVFHWGLGTLSHYGTAEVLHRRPQPS